MRVRAEKRAGRIKSFKLITGCLIFLTISIDTNAQKKLSAGLETSVLFSNIQGQGMSKDLAEGFMFGAFLKYRLPKRWSVQTGLSYSVHQPMAGIDFAKYYVSSVKPSGFADQIFLYGLNIPLLVNYQASKKFSFSLGSELFLKTMEDSKLLRNDAEAVSSTQFSVIGGVKIHVNPAYFFCRYKQGVTDINKFSSIQNWTSREIQVGVGWTIFK